MKPTLDSPLRADQIIESGQLIERLCRIAYKCWVNTPTDFYNIPYGNTSIYFQATKKQFHPALQSIILTSEDEQANSIIVSWRGTIDMAHIKADVEEAPASETFDKYQSTFLESINELIQSTTNKKKTSLILVGHSLGGSIAQQCVVALTSAITENASNESPHSYPHLIIDNIQSITLATANSPGVEKKKTLIFANTSAFLREKLALHALILRTQGDPTQHYCLSLAKYGHWKTRRIIIRPGIESSLTLAPKRLWTKASTGEVYLGLSDAVNDYLDLEQAHLTRYLSESHEMKKTPIYIMNGSTTSSDEQLQTGITIFSDTNPDGQRQLEKYLSQDPHKQLKTLSEIFKYIIPEERTQQTHDPLATWALKIVQESIEEEQKNAQEARLKIRETQRREIWKKLAAEQQRKNQSKQKALDENLARLRSQTKRLTNCIDKLQHRKSLIDKLKACTWTSWLFNWHQVEKGDVLSVSLSTTLRTENHALRSQNLASLPCKNHQTNLSQSSPATMTEKHYLEAVEKVGRHIKQHLFFGPGIPKKELEKLEKQTRSTLLPVTKALATLERKITSIQNEKQYLEETQFHTLASGYWQKSPAKW